MENFVINDHPSGYWTVSWPSWKDVKSINAKQRLLDIIFGDIKAHEVGLGYRTKANYLEIMWIDAGAFYQDSGYLNRWEEMYEICGCAFRKFEEAEQFKDILDKKYMWKILQHEF